MLSSFMAIRKMANLPVESMQTGGIWWFKNLAAPDPYFALPVISCVTVAYILEVYCCLVEDAENIFGKIFFALKERYGIRIIGEGNVSRYEMGDETFTVGHVPFFFVLSNGKLPVF
jgi:hypothetical protein